MANEVPRGKKVPKYAWGLVVLSGSIWFVGGLGLFLPGDMIFFTGNPSSYPTQASNDLNNAGRTVGVFIMAGGLLQLAVGSQAFRRGEKWAWYAIGSVPIMAVLNSYMDYVGAGGFAAYVFGSLLTFGAPSLLGLLLSVRSFFPKKRMATT